MGSKKVTVGYKYYLGVQIVVCKAADAVRRIFVGERLAWEGTAVPNMTITIDKPDLFGGESGSSAQGGVKGLVDVEFGGIAQEPNAYVQAQVGGPIPAYRGKLSMTFRGATDRSFYWAAMNPYIKPVAVTLTRILGGWSGLSSTTEVQYSNYVLYPWVEETDDPRNCKNDHEYSREGGGATWRATLEEAIADAEAASGFTIPNILLGWSQGTSDLNRQTVSPYHAVDPGEEEELFLHFNRYATGVTTFYGGLTSQPDACGAFFTAGFTPGTTPDFYWTGFNLSGAVLVSGSGIFRLSDGADGGGFAVYVPPLLSGADHTNNCLVYGSGSGYYPAFTSKDDTLIKVRRKVRAPDDPCEPRCEDPFPDYPPDSSYCVIGFDAVLRGGWALTAGTYKALAVYQLDTSEVVQYPLNPVLPSGHANYDDEVYWTAAYDAAVTAGDMPPGKTYDPTGTGEPTFVYPILLEAAYVRDGATIVEGEVWFPEYAAIECKGTLLRTEYIDLDSIANASSTSAGAAAVGVLLSDVAAGNRVEVTAVADGTYTGWSPWGEPELDGPLTGSIYRWRIIKNGDLDTDDDYGPSGTQDGYAGALAAMQAVEPVLVTGATEYLFYISDSPIEDNTGGVSLKVDIYEPDLPDMNPAHIIYQCLTEADFGIGLPRAMIDEDSFQAAAIALSEEKFGLSFIWLRQEPVEDFIKIVLDHINAALYQDRSDGNFRLKLIRDDYDVEDLDTYDESNIVEMESFSRVGWGETVNEVVIGYTNPKNEKEATVSVQNLANIQLQGGVVTSKKSYAGIRCADLALRVAQRDLKTRSTPLAAAKIKVNRSAWNVPPGAVFVLSWADYDIVSVVFRVIGIDYGTVADRTITIDCVEDVFGMPESSYGSGQDTEWVNPSQPATDVGEFKITEASYHEVFNQVLEADLNTFDGDEVFLLAMAQRGAGVNSAFQAWTAALDDSTVAELYGESTITPNAVLGADILQLTETISYTALAGAFLDEVVPGYAYIEDELIWIESIDTEAETMLVRRGIHDTIPVVHSAGAIIWFWNGESGESGVLEFVPGPVEGEEIHIWLPGRTPGDGQSLTDAEKTEYTGVARWSRPWPPADVKINDSYFPTFLEGDFDLSWVGRNKLQQTTEGEAGAIAWTEGNIDPEVGSTYTLLLKDGETDALLDTIDGLVLGDSPYTVVDPLSYGSSLLKVEFFSELDGRDSYQHFTHIVALSGLRETEDGDFRETEDGDERELEF